MLKKYQRRVKNAMSIIGLNLTNNQLVHIKSCKEIGGGMEDHLQHSQDKKFVMYPSCLLQIFHMQDEKMRQLVGPH